MKRLLSTLSSSSVGSGSGTDDYGNDSISNGHGDIEQQQQQHGTATATCSTCSTSGGSSSWSSKREREGTPASKLDTVLEEESSTTGVVVSNSYTPTNNTTLSTEEALHHTSSKKEARHVCCRHRHKLIVAVLVLLGLAAGASFFVVALKNAHEAAEERFAKQNIQMLVRFETSLSDYTNAGLWIQGYCQNPDLTPAQFHDTYEYMRATDLSFSSAGCLTDLATREQVALMEDQTRAYLALTYPNDTDWYRGATQTATPAATDGERGKQFRAVPIPANQTGPFAIRRFVQPLGPESLGNRQRLTYDQNSGTKEVSLALNRSWDTLEPTMTRRLQTKFSPTGYTLLLFHPGAPLVTSPLVATTTTNQSRSVSILTFGFKDVLRRTLQSTPALEEPVSIYVYDADSTVAMSFLGGASVSTCSPQQGPGSVCSPVDGHSDSSMLPGGATATLTQPRCELQKDISLEELKNDASVRYLQEHRFTIGSREWIYVTVAYDDTYKLSLPLLAITGAVIIVLLSLIVTLGIYSRFIRQAKLHGLRRKTETEKAQLRIDNARLTAQRERELNDYIAHEVRNPLAAALSACSFVGSAVSETEPLVDEESRQTVREDVAIIDTSLNFINELLRNMLDMHRASANQLQIEWTPVDVVQDILQPVAAMLYSRGTDVEVQVVVTPPATSVVVASDRLRLKQTVLNLGRNAIKFVQRGFVRLRTEIVDASDGTQHVVIYIEDSGPGIPTEKRDNLFAKFQDSLDALNQGTGIGLSLCKKIVDLMGGDIYLEENYDSGIEGRPGSQFVINLRTPPLSVDDMEKQLSALQQLEPPPHSSSRSSGVPVFTHTTHRAEDMVDWVGTDLPLQSNSPLTTSHVPLCTGSSRHGHDDDCNAMATTVPVAEEDVVLPETLRVLFVDDDTMLRKLFTRIIRKVAPNWDISEASNGETALRMVEERESEPGGNGSYDLIFMDQYMASVEKQLLGTETVRALRARGIKKPIICGLSANDTAKAFHDAGADAFSMKPFSCKPKDVRLQLFSILHSRQDQEPQHEPQQEQASHK